MSSVKIEDSQFPNISFTGRICTGKTYLSDFLVNEVGYTRLSFAAALKDIELTLWVNGPLRTLIYMLYKYNNVPIKKWWILYKILVNTNEIEVEHPKPRRRLQYLGNTIREKISDNYWINITLRQLNSMLAKDSTARFVIEDTRYPNEIQCLFEFGFITIKLETSLDNKLKRIKRLYGIDNYADARLHAESEESCDILPNKRFSFVITNNDDNVAINALRDIVVNYIMEHP